MIENKWEQWKASPEGKKTIGSITSMVVAKNQQYALNCLWWAFHAGNQPITGTLETKANTLLQKVVDCKSQIPAQIRKEIEGYLFQLKIGRIEVSK